MIGSGSRSWTKPEIAALVSSSRDLIAQLQDPSGAYPACPTFSAYRGYSWFRDGAFIADGMSAVGDQASATRFFDWCARTIVEREAQIEVIVRAAASGAPVAGSEMLPTRYTLDGRTSSEPWWDFQLDGYGTWLWALAEHTRRHEIAPEPWSHAVALTVDYLVSSWSRPCFDWWEERPEEVHVSTLGCIAAGLRAAIGMGVLGDARAQVAQAALDDVLRMVRHDGVVDGHLTKSVGNAAVDASLLSLVAPLRVFDAADPLCKATVDAVRADLDVDGGVHRFRSDTFYGGGQWPLLSCFLGLALLETGDEPGALRQLHWAASTVTADDELPEQVDWHLLAPDMRAQWVERWGPVATPLLWSHAMVVRLAVALGIEPESR